MTTRQQIGRVKIVVKRLFNDKRLLLALPKGAACAEVGVWRGDHAAAILRWTRPRTLLLLDPWEHRPELPGALYGGLAEGGQHTMDAVHDLVLQRFQRKINRGQVKLIRAHSTDVTLPPNSLDWVYIDGDHHYEAVKQDLEHFAQIVRTGGYLAGDDYVPGAWFGEGPKQAVDEFAQSAKCRKLTIFGKHFLIELA